MFDPPTPNADDGSDTDSAIEGRNCQNKKTATDMLDSSFDEMLKEAEEEESKQKRNMQ